MTCSLAISGLSVRLEKSLTLPKEWENICLRISNGSKIIFCYCQNVLGKKIVFTHFMDRPNFTNIHEKLFFLPTY